jgi:hypothetical protein
MVVGIRAVRQIEQKTRTLGKPLPWLRAALCWSPVRYDCATNKQHKLESPSPPHYVAHPILPSQCVNVICCSPFDATPSEYHIPRLNCEHGPSRGGLVVSLAHNNFTNHLPTDNDPRLPYPYKPHPHTSFIMPASAMEIVEATLFNDYEPTPEEISLVVATLTHDEERWRDRHGMFKREGYELRPRLRPGWEPSWTKSGADPMQCEDGEILPVGCFAASSSCHRDRSSGTPQACGRYPRGYWQNSLH